ncbi:MAG: PorV/PorQ family protein [Elusimicrobiota bacterium]
MNGLRLLILALTLLGGSREAAAAAAGGEPFSFLFLDANARAAALGGAYTSLATDSNALLYNPAGLGRITDHELTFMHNSHILGITREYFGFAARRGWGLNLNYLSMRDIPRTTVSNPSGAGLGGAALTDFAFTVGYGRVVHELLSLGVGVKYIRESVDNTVGTARAIDLGALYEISNVPDLRLGIALQNIGSTTQFERAKENLPLNIRMGASFDFDLMQRTHTAAFDVTKERSDSVRIACGAEFHPVPTVPVRIGFNTRNDAGPGVTAGVGWSANYFIFDYAFAPFGDLGSSHLFSVTARWGGHDRPLFSGRRTRPVKNMPQRITADSYLRRAGEYIDLDLLEEAKKELETVDTLIHANDARRVRYLERLGMIEYKENRIAGAQQYFTRSLRLAIQLSLRGPAVADAYYGMGLCLVKEDKFDYSEKFFRKALRAGPVANTRSAIKQELRRLHDRKRPL